VALVDVDEVAEHPAVGGAPVVGELLLVGAAADVLHPAHAPALDAGAVGPVPLGQPRLPHVGRLDDVVVDADDLGELGHGFLRESDPNLTGRQIIP
jgi:hypothetical protein